MNKRSNKVPSAGTKADSSTGDEVNSVSQNSRKPNVVCRQSPTNWMSFDEYKKLNKLKSFFNSGYSNKVVIPKMNKRFVSKKVVVMYDEEGKINEGF